MITLRGLRRRLARARWEGAVVSVLLGPVPAAAHQFVYVASPGTGTISAIDVATNAISATVALNHGIVEQRPPIEIAVSPDGSRAYGVNRHSSTLSVFDTATHSLITAAVPVGTGTGRVALTPDGRFAYLTNASARTVSALDTRTNTVVAVIRVEHPPFAIAISPDGARAYVACNESGGTARMGEVVVIDIGTNTVSAAVPMSLGAWLSAIAVAPDGQLVYVIDWSTGTVAVLDPALNAVTATIPVGGNKPFGGEDIAIAPDGRFAYVARQQPNLVSVLDTARQTVAGTIALAAPPERIVLTADGGRAYVTLPGTCTVAVVDTATRAVVTNIAVDEGLIGIASATLAQVPASPTPAPTATPGAAPPAGHACAYVPMRESDAVAVIDTATQTITGRIPVTHPLRVAISPDGARAYVTTAAHAGRPARVVVIDTATNRVTNTIAAGIAPVHVAFAPDGSRAYTTQAAGCYGLVAIDPTTDTVTDRVAIGSNEFSFGIALTPDGTRAYITELKPHTVSVVDLPSSTLLATIAFDDQPREVAVTPDGRFAYVTTIGSVADQPSPLVVIDTTTNTVTTDVLIGKGPTAVLITPDGRFAYVANAGSDTVSVIDTATTTVATSIPVGEYPIGIAFTPDGLAAYVINFGGTSVSVIDTTTAAVTSTIALDGAPESIAIASVANNGCAVPPTPTPTITRTPTITPTQTAAPSPTPGSCVGDCNRDGSVTVDELVTGVAIALGTRPLDACRAFDANGDGTVTVDEVIAAVGNALNGCAAGRSVTRAKPARRADARALAYGRGADLRHRDDRAGCSHSASRAGRTACIV